MALTAEREAYIRLAEHSMANSRQIAPNCHTRSPKAYGAYIAPNSLEQTRPSQLNGYPINGLSPLSPSLNSNHHHHHQQQQQQQLSETNLYIKNLSPDFSDKDLAALVDGCGKIKSMKAIIDKETKKCKGFGFIDFESHEDARSAISELQKKGYTAQLAKSSQQQEQDETNLYFANLDQQMTENDLRQALSEFGTVVSVRILRDQHKESRGVGFARMNDRDQCQEIINQFHNKTFQNFPGKVVQVKFADASKNKKSYKGGIEDLKGGQPIYSPIDQTGSYPHPAILYSHWSPMPHQSLPVPGQPGGQLHPNVHHPMYSQPAQIRAALTAFNQPMPPYMSGPHDTGATFVVPVPVQQLQQLQIANGHPPPFCLMNPPHPTLFMTAPPTTAQPPSQHDS